MNAPEPPPTRRPWSEHPDRHRPALLKRAAARHFEIVALRKDAEAGCYRNHPDIWDHYRGNALVQEQLDILALLASHVMNREDPPDNGREHKNSVDGQDV